MKTWLTYLAAAAMGIAFELTFGNNASFVWSMGILSEIVLKLGIFIVFGLTGTGYFDMVAYEKFHDGKMDDYIPTDEELERYRAKLPKVD